MQDKDDIFNVRLGANKKKLEMEAARLTIASHQRVTTSEIMRRLLAQFLALPAKKRNKITLGD